MKEVKENVKYIIIKILYIIIIPIVIYDMILIAQSIINPYRTPSFFGIKTFNIVSGSMKPVIDINDIVIVKEVVDESELKPGNIISFRLNNEIITHRILKIEKENDRNIYITKGDNNEVEDVEKLEFGQIEGKQIGIIPKIGMVLNFLKNKIVFAVILVILIVCFLIERRKINNKIKRKEKRIKWDRKVKRNTIKEEANEKSEIF